jgi:hypothetical protein
MHVASERKGSLVIACCTPPRMRNEGKLLFFYVTIRTMICLVVEELVKSTKTRKKQSFAFIEAICATVLYLAK